MTKRLCKYLILIIVTQNTLAMDEPATGLSDFIGEISDEENSVPKLQAGEYIEELENHSPPEWQEFSEKITEKIKYCYFSSRPPLLDEESRCWVNNNLSDVAAFLKSNDWKFEGELDENFKFEFLQTIFSPCALSSWERYLKAKTCVLKKLIFVDTEFQGNLTLLENGLSLNNSVEEISFTNSRGISTDSLALSCAHIIERNSTLCKIHISEEQISNLGTMIIAKAIQGAAMDSALELFSLKKNKIPLMSESIVEIIAAARCFYKFRDSFKLLKIDTDIVLLPKLNERQEFLKKLSDKIRVSFFTAGMPPVDGESRPWVNGHLADIAEILMENDWEFKGNSNHNFEFGFLKTNLNSDAMISWGKYLKTPTCVLKILTFVSTDFTGNLRDMEEGLLQNHSIEEISFINNRGFAKDSLALLCAHIIEHNRVIRKIYIHEEQISSSGTMIMAKAIRELKIDSMLRFFSLLNSKFDLKPLSIEEIKVAVQRFNNSRGSNQLIFETDVIYRQEQLDGSGNKKNSKYKGKIIFKK